MLPAEVFADAVAFLRLYDLTELPVANRHCSGLAMKHAATIRKETFAGLHFVLHSQAVIVCRNSSIVAYLNFPSELATAEFVSAAFPNCVFESVDVQCSRNNHLMNAIVEVADSVVITDNLSFDVGPPATLRSAPEMVEFVARVRSLKVSPRVPKDAYNRSVLNGDALPKSDPQSDEATENS